MYDAYVGEGVAILLGDEPTRDDVLVWARRTGNEVAAEMKTESVELLNRKVDEIRSYPGVMDTMTLIRMG